MKLAVDKFTLLAIRRGKQFTVKLLLIFHFLLKQETSLILFLSQYFTMSTERLRQGLHQLKVTLCLNLRKKVAPIILTKHNNADFRRAARKTRPCNTLKDYCGCRGVIRWMAHLYPAIVPAPHLVFHLHPGPSSSLAWCISNVPHHAKQLLTLLRLQLNHAAHPHHLTVTLPSPGLDKI